MAIHDSEFTRALEGMAATAQTPTGPGTTNKQWWITDWHYFVMPDALKEVLRSDGTAFQVVADSNLLSGVLLTNGVPRFPIVFSLASEAIADQQIASLTNYVAAGGFLFLGSSAFTRNTNGSSRGDFAIASALGLSMVSPGLTNWSSNFYFTKQAEHRLTSHIPAGQLTWRVASSADEISWGISPTHPFSRPHLVWKAQANGATVLAAGDSYPYLAVKAYGKGYFIYYAGLQPLVGHGGFAPTLYSYLIFRRAIEWAFETAGMPVPKVSPWPFQYDAAFIARHDLENYTNSIAEIEASARFEFTNGARGDYYFCTGTLREDASNKNTIIDGLRRAMADYGATIGPHNGGLKNPNNPSLVRGDYDYWHWGPDEALDATPSGYPNGKSYAFTSMSNSFLDIEQWLPGQMTNGMRLWVSCYFNATREDSFDIQQKLNVKVTGDQKLGPFPHWTLSTQTPGKRYGFSSQPPSDWFIVNEFGQGLVAQSLEPWHRPGVHTITTLRDAIDFYYDLGGLINFYSHSLSHRSDDRARALAPEYILYSMNTNLHPRLWSANAIMVHEWWLQRSNVQIQASFATNGNQSRLTLSVRNSTNPNTAVEASLPGGVCNLEVFTNGVAAPSGAYRLRKNSIKVRTGTTVTNVFLTYYPLAPGGLVFTETFDSVSTPSLPAGWTTSALGAQSPWVTQTSVVDSSPNAVFCPNPAATGICQLVSAPIVLPSGKTQLSFRNNYDLEAGYDGGVLEMKTGTNSYIDILDAGGVFVNGGYNSTLDTRYQNPLGGRRAWSGTTAGFTTTVVDLPDAASGQTVQFRWQCGTDNSTALVGWRIDSIVISNSLCLCCGATNTAPVLPAQQDRMVAELSSLIVTNTAFDPDLPQNNMFYSLLNAPAGAAISGSGVISWIPSEGQGPGTYTLTTRVTDDGVPPLSATNSFQVVVTEVNTSPVLPPQAGRFIVPGATLVVTNTASDADIPANPLTYSLAVGPPNATISSVGVITWTPAEEHRGTNLFTTVVSDGTGGPGSTATNTFAVIVESEPLIVFDSMLLVSETCLPANGSIDPDENVTVLFGFKNNGTGSATNLIVTMLATNGVVPPAPQSYGTLLPDGVAVTMPFTFSIAGPCGASPVVYFQMQDATRDLGSVAVPVSLGRLATNFSESFDSVSAPLLPSAWSSSQTGGLPLWVTHTQLRDTPPNSAYGNDSVNAGVSELLSPEFLCDALQAQLRFRNSYDLEAGGGTLAYDGGVLEIKIGTNGFMDILQAGGSFVTGGYNRTIVSNSGNPLAGRQAWSGNSGGFLSTVVNLPAAASDQVVRFRWRCGTDSDVERGGWRIDSVAVSGLTCCFNSPPVPGTVPDQLVIEGYDLVVSNAAVDPGNPFSTLSYTLTASPAGAQVDTNGVITWVPTELHGGSTNVFTTVVANGLVPDLRATNSFTVVVLETNSAPFLPELPDLETVELASLVLTNTATDPDLPANNLLYTLQGPVGALIDSGGVITWTPTEEQGPSTNLFQTVVTDDGVPPLSTTNSFTVVVLETNSAPSLPLQTDLEILELTPLLITNTATDPDLPVNGLVYTLEGPAGATIDTNGLITWTPTEEQGPSTNLFQTVVTDDGVPPLSTTNSFTVVVLETNGAPSLPLQTDLEILELKSLIITNTATDPDLPVNGLVYTLKGPAGATIDTNGLITWTPTEEQGPSTNLFRTIATDDGVPPLSTTNTFIVVVLETNGAPSLPLQTDREILELTSLVITNTATDPDLPVNGLLYTLEGPAGATIDTNGLITWTPSEEQGPSTNLFQTIVTDDGVPPLSTTNSFTVVVLETNSAPSLPVQPDRELFELTLLVLTNTATDPDLPPNKLTYTLTAPEGATIDPQGVITWTPSEAQGPGTYVFIIGVADDGAPSMSVESAFTVTVLESNSPPVLPPDANAILTPPGTLSITNTAADLDLPANNLSYSLLVAPSGASIDADGIISWTPSETDSQTTNAFITVVFDDGVPSMSATNTVTVVVNTSPQRPVLTINPVQTPAAVLLTWQSIAGRTYRLEYKDDLQSSNWQSLGDDILAEGTTTSATNSLAGAAQRFYRLILLP